MLTIARLRIRLNNNTPDNTSASLGCSIFSEHYDASWPARMKYAVRYRCSARSVVGQRGSGADLQDCSTVSYER